MIITDIIQALKVKPPNKPYKIHLLQFKWFWILVWNITTIQALELRVPKNNHCPFTIQTTYEWLLQTWIRIRIEYYNYGLNITN
jgi:hypothetical protein